MPAAMPGFFLYDRLLNLREEIELRRQELMDLYERDLRDWGRDDTWEMVLPANMARA